VKGKVTEKMGQSRTIPAQSLEAKPKKLLGQIEKVREK
jgi:hypothetical protein